jgi:hypothetical protein
VRLVRVSIEVVSDCKAGYVHKTAFELILKEFKGFTENDQKNM